MARSRIASLLCVGLLALALAGCSDRPTSRAEFVRYVPAPDGSELALVRNLGASPLRESTVQCRLRDLKPGEVVLIENGTNDWDQPQWMPTQAVVERAK